MIEKYEGFIFDLDGTVYLEDRLIPKADLVIQTLKEKAKKIVFVSNKTTGSVEDYYNFLLSKGIDTNKDEFVTSTEVIKKYLQKNYSSKYFYSIGEEKFINEIRESGLSFSVNPRKINIVIVTLDRTLNYSKLEIAARALDAGAKFFAANIDNTCPVKGGEILDAGSTISALKKRTNRELEKHFGKPSEYILNEALRRMKIDKDKCLIVGDRLETDIAMGNKFGIDTALVNTGVSKHLVYNGNYKPTFKIDSIANLLF